MHGKLPCPAFLTTFLHPNTGPAPDMERARSGRAMASNAIPQLSGTLFRWGEEGVKVRSCCRSHENCSNSGMRALHPVHSHQCAAGWIPMRRPSATSRVYWGPDRWTTANQVREFHFQDRYRGKECFLRMFEPSGRIHANVT